MSRVAKDWMVNHYVYGDTHPEIDVTFVALLKTAHRVWVTGGSQQLRCNMAASVLFGRCRYMAAGDVCGCGGP